MVGWRLGLAVRRSRPPGTLTFGAIDGGATGHLGSIKHAGQFLMTAPVATSAVASPCGGSCARYTPSPLEAEWTNTSAMGRICVLSALQLERAKHWLEYAAASRGREPPTPSARQRAVLSRFTRRTSRADASRAASGGPAPEATSLSNDDDDNEEWIEPLTGMARHPFAAIAGCIAPLYIPPSVRELFWGTSRRRERGSSGSEHKWGQISILNTSYLIPANQCGRRRARAGGASLSRARGRNLFFDLGCGSTGMSGEAHTVRTHARESGAERQQNGTWAMLNGKLKAGGYAAAPGITFNSLRFFTSLYARNCIKFDDVYAWEAAPIAAGGEWWRGVPVEIASRLHLYNLPVHLGASSGGAGAAAGGGGAIGGSSVAADSIDIPESYGPGLTKPIPPQPAAAAASPSAAGVGDPLAVLRSVASPSDFVAMKIDVDGGPELELVERIAREPRLYRLVDELYFEYHFYFDGRNFGWLTHKGGANHHKWGRHTVDDALGLMRRLRERGVRAHFWV